MDKHGVTQRKIEVNRRVLLATMSLGLGGAETHVVALAAGLKKRGWDVVVTSAGGYLVRELERSGITHVEAPLNSRSPLKMVHSLLRLDRTVRSLNVGLVHAHARIPGFLARHVSMKCGIPMVMTYHFPFKSGFPWTLFSPAGDVTIAVSEDIRRYVSEKFRIPPESTVVIPNGVDTMLFRPPDRDEVCSSRQALNLAPWESPVLTYASRLTPELARSAIAAIHAAEALVSEFPRAVLLVAGDGPSTSQVRRCATDVNFRCGREVVRVLGLVENMVPVYWASSVVIGMSRVALEAMACGLPVVIAGPAGVSGLVTAENTDFLALRNFTSRDAPEQLSPDGILRQVLRALRSPDLARDLASFGRDLIVNSYSVDAMVTMTEKVYLGLLGKSSEPS